MNAMPPKLSRPLASFGAVALGFAAAGMAALIYFFNPSAHHFFPVCQFHRLTGLNCPGCGGTRAAYALLHGDVLAALRDNALLVIGLPLLLARGFWFALNRRRGRAHGDFIHAMSLIPLLVVIIAFGVLRNLPPFAFLSP
jgi:hypothetical protein